MDAPAATGWLHELLALEGAVPAYALLLVLHGCLAGVDVLLNHEYLARLPHRPDAHLEQRLHSAREGLFGVIFVGLAWFQWHGWLAWLLAALFAAELAVSIVDTVLEGDMRVLPVPERVLHVLMLVNFGLIVAALAPHVLHWAAMPTGLSRINLGWISWAMSVLGALACAWCVRDGLSVPRLRRAWTAATAAQARSRS